MTAFARFGIDKFLPFAFSSYPIMDVSPPQCTSLLAWLLSWLLQEEELVAARLQLQAAADLPEAGVALPAVEQGQSEALSEWLLASVSVDLLRGQVRGSYSAARFRACLPRLRRFLCGSRRQRTHWFSQMGAWLVTRPPPPVHTGGPNVLYRC